MIKGCCDYNCVYKTNSLLLCISKFGIIKLDYEVKETGDKFSAELPKILAFPPFTVTA